MKKAILAAEDERFYSHGGVDYLSVVRAAASNLASGTQQGAGTITMQVARNFFLTREKTVTRKLREVLLAWKIEANLTKDEILQLYVNQIFLGQRAYGFAAASQIYFGKPLKDVTPAEAAMLAGLPKAPSAFNPVTNPRRAKTRQLYVLRRMHELRFISDDQFREAQSAPLAVPAGLREVVPIARRIRRRDGAPGRLRGLRRGRLHQGPDRPHDDPQGRSGGRLCCAAEGRRSTTTVGTATAGPEAYVSLPEDAGRAGGRARARLPGRSRQRRPDRRGRARCVGRPRSRPCWRTAKRSRSPGDGLRFAAPALRDKSAAATRIRPGAVIRVARDDKGRWDDRPDPAGRGGVRLDAARSDGAHPLARRRLRLRSQQVQPRHAGAAAAGFGVQAVHLLGGAGEGLHAGDGRQRRAVLRPGRQGRRRGLGAQELRRQVRGPDARAHRARQIEEPRHRPRAAGDRAAVRAGLHRPLRLRSRSSIRPT